MTLRLRSAQFLDGFDDVLTAARRGEQSQLGVLLDVYRRYLLSVASEKLPRDVIVKTAPSDIVQETLFQACRAFDGFRGSSEQELRAWLNRILVRKIYEAHRHYRGFAKRDISREIRLSEIQNENAALVGPAGDAPSPAQSTRKADTALSFDEALATLNKEQQEVIRRRSFDQLSFEEVGVMLGRSADAAQKLWGRAVRNLTRALRSHESGG